MSVLPIRHLPDPILKRPTRRVDRLTNEISRFIEGMIRTMRHHPRCVGLAAPQVGSDWRIAVMDVSARPGNGGRRAGARPASTSSQGLIVLVNPVIEVREGATIGREGCLSIPDFTGNVRRATRVRLNALNQFGMPCTWQLEGFEAIVAQHEIDHLDGCLFLDRVANLNTDVFRRKTYL